MKFKENPKNYELMKYCQYVLISQDQHTMTAFNHYYDRANAEERKEAILFIIEQSRLQYEMLIDRIKNQPVKIVVGQHDPTDIISVKELDKDAFKG